MYRPAAVKAAPGPEKGGECARTGSRPYSAAANVAGILKREIFAEQSTGAVSASTLAITDDF